VLCNTPARPWVNTWAAADGLMAKTVICLVVEIDGYVQHPMNHLGVRIGN
jgi:hypothetical protein